ncbi:MAG: TraR/DksA family transcriptional regulator [Gammaproteobacteria bacterium]|nr:TraR/DksA family transcriptional regulator [Gammaproteobacteria bacterium]
MAADSLIDVQAFKTMLLDKQNSLELVKGTALGAAEVVELDQTKVGRLSRMDALQAQAMSLETNRRRDIELLRIESALQRIENSEFGYCLRCGEDISVKRLEIDPATPVCIDCASSN